MSDDDREGSTFVRKSSIPTLTGTDNVVAWKRGLTNYLREKDALRVLEGRETEPYRMEDAAVPDDAYAGYEPPAGPGAEIPGDIGTSTTNADLNHAQLEKWRKWERKEAKARSAVLMSISEGLATEVEGMWSAHRMYTHLLDMHKVNTTERRADLAHRIQLLRLPLNASRSQMLKHFELFNTLVAEAHHAKMLIPEWDKCERFLFTLPKDVETLRIQWRILPTDRQNWKELITMFKTLADERGLTVEREAMVNSLFSNQGRSNGNQSTKGGERQGDKPKGKPKGDQPSNKAKPKADGGKKKKDKAKCNWCGWGSHTEGDCRKKAAGEPSMEEIKQATLEIRKRKGTGSANVISNSNDEAEVFGFNASATADNLPTVHKASAPSVSIYAAMGSTDEFLLDSGASHHIVPSNNWLSNVNQLPRPLRFNLAGESMDIEANEKGDLAIRLSSGTTTVISDIHVVPASRLNILSLGQLAKEGWNLDFNRLKLSKDGLSLGVKLKGVLPFVTLKGYDKAQSQLGTINNAADTPLPTDVETSVSRSESILYNEHCRLGHIHPDRIIDLAKSGQLPSVDLEDITNDPFKLSDCITCNRQKATNQPKGGKSVRGSKEGEMLHVDIAGPFDPSVVGNTYYLAIVADYSMVRQIVPIKLKSEAWEYIPKFVALFEKQSSIPIKYIRSDGGSEFGGGDNGSLTAKSFFERTGIVHQVSPRYTPELNGVVERFNRTIKEMISSMVDGTPLGHKYWDFAGRYGCNILNMTTTNDDGLNPWKLLTGREATPDKIREFGEMVTTMIPQEIRSKASFMQPRAELGRVIGMPPMTSGYLIRFEATGEERVSRDVKSANMPLSTPLAKPIVQRHNATFPRATNGPIPTFTEMIRTAPASRQQKMLEQSTNPNTPIGWARARAEEIESQASAPPPVTAQTPTVPPIAPPQETPPNVAAATDNLASREAFILSLDISDDEPRDLKAAFSGSNADEWRAAVDKELEGLAAKGTYIEDKLPKGRKAIGCKWVLKRKRDADGNITKYKARLVAKGYSQKPGVDFEETYAPVGRLTTLRIFFSIVASLGLKCRQADAEAAYLNGLLDRPLYMLYPEGMKASSKEVDVLLLLKTIYGLKQSGRAWWLVLGDKLVELGFIRCESDWGLYIKRDKAGDVTMMILVYVDDLLACAKTVSEIDDIFNQIGKQWNLSLLGDVSNILGMLVRRDLEKNILTISQGGYIDKLAERFPVLGRTSGKYSPLPTTDLDSESPLLPSVSPYLEIVGSIQWLATSTRPDVAFAASFLGRYNSSPTEALYDLALRVVKYLVNTRDYGLELGGKSQAKLTAYSDSDWAGCLSTRRSTSGYVSYLFGGAINWYSRRQATVSSSSMEAEYIAGAEATHDIVWLRSLLTEIGLLSNEPIMLYIDNQSAIRLAGNPVAHGRSKHIDIKHHIIRERVESKIIELDYIETKKQRADIFTKALSGPTHADHLVLLRIVRVEQSDIGHISVAAARVTLQERIRRSNPLKDRLRISAPPPTTSKLALRITVDRKSLQERIDDKANAQEGKQTAR